MYFKILPSNINGSGVLDRCNNEHVGKVCKIAERMYKHSEGVYFGIDETILPWSLDQQDTKGKNR